MEEEWRGGRLRQKDAGSEKLNWFGRPPWISSWKVTCIPILNSRLRRLHSLFNLFRLASTFWLKRLLSKQFYSSHCIQHPLAQDGMLAQQRLWWPTGTGTSRIEVRRLRTECHIRMDFDTNEYPNIFVSRKWHERISEYIRMNIFDTNEYPNIFLLQFWYEKWPEELRRYAPTKGNQKSS